MEVKRLPNGVDGSIHHRLKIAPDCIVEACIKEGRLICHTWFCEGRGRLALKEIEAYAKKFNLKVQVPCVINAALERILTDNGYTEQQENIDDGFGGKDVIDIWEKVEK